jgi:hypothetical protein
MTLESGIYLNEETGGLGHKCNIEEKKWGSKWWVRKNQVKMTLLCVKQENM